MTDPKTPSSSSPPARSPVITAVDTTLDVLHAGERVLVDGIFFLVDGPRKAAQGLVPRFNGGEVQKTFQERFRDLVLHEGVLRSGDKVYASIIVYPRPFLAATYRIETYTLERADGREIPLLSGARGRLLALFREIIGATALRRPIPDADSSLCFFVRIYWNDLTAHEKARALAAKRPS